MEQLEQILDAVFERVQNHWVELLTAAAFTLVGYFLGNWKAKGRWRRREFLDRVNFSLNRIEPPAADAKPAEGEPAPPGTLRFRTLAEVNVTEVFPNAEARARVAAAARQTTAADPILPLPESDYWYYLNAVLNELSERFAAGWLRKDLGEEVRSARFLVALTAEVKGSAKTHKVRAMVMRKDALLDLPAVTPRFEAPTHDTRWETLNFLAAEYRRNPWRFLEVELCL